MKKQLYSKYIKCDLSSSSNWKMLNLFQKATCVLFMDHEGQKEQDKHNYIWKEFGGWD